MTEFPLAPEVPMERVLLHELIHRINNEFSALIGAVSRTAARSVNHEVKVALAHIIELLSHYAELHRALQMPENDAHIDASNYLENLCHDQLVGIRIDLVLTATPLQLPPERCWRLGMIVYELVTNAAGTRLATEMKKFVSSCRVLAVLLNAGSTMAQPQQRFSEDAGSGSSTNWSKVSMDALNSGLDRADHYRY
jgi:hypothetical protein